MKRFFILSVFFLGVSAYAWGASSTLDISVDHGVPVTLSAPAASVFIANPEIADVQVMSPTSVIIFGKRTGETTFMATGSNGATLAQRTVVVMQDLSNLREELDAAIPGNKIHAKALPNGIVLTGEAKDATAVADAYRLAQRYISSNGDIINRIKVVGSNQIHIRVRFAEVQRNIDNTLGIDWGSAFSFGGFVLGIASGNAVANTAAAGATVSQLGGGVAGVNGIGNGVVTPLNATNALATPFGRTSNSSLATPNDVIGVSRAGEHFNLNNLIDALSQDGLITILAEPNLTAMSGETASFLAGGEFPIPIPQGNGTISIQFKKYGISLEFTPTLLTESRISLHVKPEVSELTQTGSIILSNITVPALTTRKAETTVELGSGESFAIAGLLDSSQAQTVNEYPIIGDMPIIGPLFRSNHFVNGQTELVVVITPYIVKPSDERQLALPTDGFSPPSEYDRVIGLRQSASDPTARTMSGDLVAKKVEPSIAATVPSEPPVAATVPVEPSNADVVPAVPVAIEPNPLVSHPSRSAPAKFDSTEKTPEGPGGFILE